MRRIASRTPIVLAAVAAALAATTIAATAGAPDQRTDGAANGQAAASQGTHAGILSWAACADAEGFDCAHLTVPRDYGDRTAGTFRLSVARLPARDRQHRIGTLFVNFGGPGGTGVQTLKSNGKRLFADINRRFDIVSWDPRGVGESTPAIDCQVDQEKAGPFSQPFMTPLTLDAGRMATADTAYVRRCKALNKGVLPYVSTANTARDLDLLRQAVGDRKLTYLGLSYGTYLGVTYASMFPNSYRALALEGILDPDSYADHPIQLQATLSAALERATGRFLQACAGNQSACSHFGGSDPGAALDRLIDRLRRHPLQVGSRTLDGDDVLVALGQGLHSKESWPALAKALAAADSGDGTELRALTDGFYGRRTDGSYRPSLDDFFAISALDQRNPTDMEFYMDAGEQSWNDFDHAYYLSGYTDHAWGSFDVQPHGVFRGPFRAAPKADPILVIGTTFDPATPYKAAVSLTHELGNARLLTMDGDGHGAYGGESPCIDKSVNSYLADLIVPTEGTRCRQDVPFS